MDREEHGLTGREAEEGRVGDREEWLRTGIEEMD